MATDYSKLKVTELKDVLKERGIPSTGLSRKQQIIDALEAHDAENGGKQEDVSTDTDKHVEEAEKVGPHAAVPPEVEAEGNESVGEEERIEKDVVAPSAGVQSGERSTETAVVEHEGAAMEQKDAVSVATEALPSPRTSPAPKAEPSPLEVVGSASADFVPPTPPARSSPAADSQSSETRKRKRRSPTPPPSAETVNKRLKSAQENLIVLPEDQVVSDAAVSVENSKESERTSPHGASDDMMDVTSSQVGPQDHGVRAETIGTTISHGEHDDDVEAEQTTARAIHPATRALYIRDLVRPLQPQQLRDHLVTVAAPPHSDPDESAVESFHLDTIRTHAFVVLTSMSAAARVRSALHDRVWPDEPARKPLWVDFVPEEKVQAWIETEQSSGTGRHDTKRWEVVYEDSGDGTVASLQEVAPASGTGFSNRDSSLSGQGQGMPNAPLGPRASRPTSANMSPRAPSAPIETSTKPIPANASFDVLDQRFNSTTAKPKLYYLPVAKDLVEKRMSELDVQTSANWDRSRGPAETDQLRRYTFEDGDRLVDGGPDIGNFGRRAPPRGRGGGYRGRW